MPSRFCFSRRSMASPNALTGLLRWLGSCGNLRRRDRVSLHFAGQLHFLAGMGGDGFRTLIRQLIDLAVGHEDVLGALLDAHTRTVGIGHLLAFVLSGRMFAVALAITDLARPRL